MNPSGRLIRTGLVVAMGMLLGSCAGMATEPPTESAAPVAAGAGSESAAYSSPPAMTEVAETGSQSTASEPAPLETEVYRGTGRFTASDKSGAPSQAPPEEGDITLNFQGTDLHQVVKVVLGDILELNYVIDPGVAGSISLQTSRPVGRGSLLPMLESLLRANDLALLRQQGTYRIMPMAQAPRSAVAPQMGRRMGPGYSVQLVPLTYIAAREMQKILEPFTAKDALLMVDEGRNLLMLAGTSQELESWLETIALFDVDWLKGQSVGLFPLEYAEAKTVAGELEHVIGTATDGKLAGMVRVQPLERLNALLVVTAQARYLDKIQTWIGRLDRVGVTPGMNLYVYRVKNRKAVELAEIVSAVFEGQSDARVDKPARLAPGLESVTLESADSKQAAKSEPRRAAGMDAGVALPAGGDVRVVADEPNNAILVMATPEEYRILESALRKLDTLPLQVLIETSIVDVILTDDLQYGFEWFFNNSLPDGKTGFGALDFGGIAGAGFTYSVVNSAGVVRAVLNALAEDSKLNVISSPSLMVLDNHTAEIRVGNQVPIRTSTAGTLDSISGDPATTTVLESIEYKDTGVLLTVTPRVNPGGLVTMEVSQEVTDVGEVDPATNNRTFLQRNINSTVAVQSGQTIVLGGLITENDNHSESGIPGLYKLPFIGNLFGITVETNTRNELLVMLTPDVVENPQDADEIVEEYRKLMRNLRQDWVVDSGAS